MSKASSLRTSSSKHISTNAVSRAGEHMGTLSYRGFKRRLPLTLTISTRMLNKTYSPIISPSIHPSSPPSLGGDQTRLVHSLSASSVQSLAELLAGGNASANTTLDPKNAQVVTEEGLRHSSNILEARRYKTDDFSSHLLACIKALHIPTWNVADINPQGIKVQRVSGSMTNAVFFVSYPTSQSIRTLLLRIYGSSSGSLISRPRELHTLHILSSQYNIGPKVYGTFENGRIEEYFESTTLTANDMRNPQTSAWIACRMAELHSVDIEVIEETSPNTAGEGKGWDICVKVNVKSWLGLARNVLALPAVSADIRESIDLDSFEKEWQAYMKWLKTVDDVEGTSRRVFAHNDAQYGNLLRRTTVPGGTIPHQQIIVVDFEYAGPNPASYDIANHFHEWTADYHGSTPHLLDASRYPTVEEQSNFLEAYVQQCTPLLSESERASVVKSLHDQVRYWSPASHAMWAVWGVVQAREDVENGFVDPEFDYLGYTQCRLAGFRRELLTLKVI